MIHLLKRYSLLSITFLCCQLMYSQVHLPTPIRDSMILQRDAKVNIWGWAKPGEKVQIKFNKKNYKTTTAANGKWKLQLPATKAGGPYSIQIEGSNKISLKEILFGDVWLCSGQSNMVHQVHLHQERYAEDIENANYPEIRHFIVPGATDLLGPKENIQPGYWKWANQKDIMQFSGVAFSFAKTLYEKYKVPVGLINASVGGPPIESWMSDEGLKEFPASIKKINENRDTAAINTNNRKARQQQANLKRPDDQGLTGDKKWYDTEYIPKGWRNIMVPGFWEDQGNRDLDGIVWYRKEISLPSQIAELPGKIYMGRIVDADQLYVNGKLIGQTYYQYPQRKYQVPAGILKSGKNIITIRVTNFAAKGGFVTDKPYMLIAGRDSFNLKGEWQYKVGAVFIPPQEKIISEIALDYQPTSLYNGMIAPITNYTIKGILWYQGEGNLGNPSNYGQLLPAMINDWRKQWSQGDIPFLTVQLPNYGDHNYRPIESSWAILREGQNKSISVPNTAIAVAIDLGEWNDIHPDNKRDVGIRLALAAQQLVYGEKDKNYMSPLFESVRKDNKNLIIEFKNAIGGLVTNDGEAPGHFAIAGADKKFVWANARIDSNKVIVWNDSIAEPMYVRYAWADNPTNANLYNKEGLPASPFRTDN